jgi:hypothetical protein
VTVQQLRPPVVTGHVLSAQAALAAAAQVPLGSVGDEELPETLAEVAALEAQAAALKLRVLAEADAREIAERRGDTGTDAWAARLTGTSRAVMSGGIWLARLLRDKYDATREAFASGRINEEQMRVIVRAAEKLPAEVTDEQRAEAEAALVDKAVNGLSPRSLRRSARRMLEVVSRALADRQEADALEDEEEEAEVETWLNLQDNADGTFSGRFVIPELHGRLLEAALERLSAPRRWSVDSHGEMTTDPTLPGCGPTLNYTERLGAAFCELLEHLPSGRHGSSSTTVLVHVDYEHLLDGLAGAQLDTGTRISVSTARRLACNAGILPVVLGGVSQPLDVGRERRLHTVAQRRALSTQHETCAAEGCERPFAWCEIHHPHSWASGGQTTIGNALPLCGWHHRRAHDRRYRTRTLSDGSLRFHWRT